MSYKIQITEAFNNRYVKLVKKDKILMRRINKTIELLRQNPFYPGLHSHIVDEDFYYGNIYSSRVTGDIRILWAFDPKQRLVLILLKVGGHDYVYD